MDAEERRRRRNAYVRARLLDEEDREGRGFQAKVARTAGISSAHVANFINGKSGEAGEAGEKIAETLWSLGGDKLDEAAAAWGVQHWKPGPDFFGTLQKQNADTLRRAEDEHVWRAFAASHAIFDEHAEATHDRAESEGWPPGRVNRVLNIAAKHLPRYYGGGDFTRADVRLAIERGVAIVEGRDPDEVLAPPKVNERAPPYVPPVPVPGETMAERSARADREEVEKARRKKRR